MSRPTWGTQVLYGGVVVVALLGISVLFEHVFGPFALSVLDSDMRILLFSLGLIAIGPLLLLRYLRVIAGQSSLFRIASLAVFLTLSVSASYSAARRRFVQQMVRRQ